MVLLDQRRLSMHINTLKAFQERTESFIYLKGGGIILNLLKHKLMSLNLSLVPISKQGLKLNFGLAIVIGNQLQVAANQLVNI